jgi:diacylglycerol kinase (ATP)
VSEQKADKVLLFYNPYSGNGLFKNSLDLIIGRYQQAGLQVIPVRSSRDMGIERFMDTMNEAEYRQIVVAGGDGTINICVNAMIRNNLHLPLAIFPVGTANDFAYYFHLPTEVEEMIEVALHGDVRTADVGLCNDRCFINVAALGALVDVSQKTDPDLKNTLGLLSYYLRALGELTSLKPLPVRLITPEETREEEIYFMVVMNGKAAGGFKKISPQADINDGLFDVVVFRKMPFMEFGPMLFSVLQGNHPNNRNVVTFQTDRLRIESEVEITTDVDGEKGEPLPLDFSMLHKRLRICTPKGSEKHER